MHLLRLTPRDRADAALIHIANKLQQVLLKLICSISPSVTSHSNLDHLVNRVDIPANGLSIKHCASPFHCAHQLSAFPPRNHYPLLFRSISPFCNGPHRKKVRCRCARLRRSDQHHHKATARVDTNIICDREFAQERETDCLQVAIVGVRNPVDNLKISARVRPLLPCLREHNIKQASQKKQPTQAAFFVWIIGNVDKPTRRVGACSAPFCHSS